MRRVKLTGLEEVKKLIEEGRVSIRDDAKHYLEEISSYTWGETRERGNWGIDFSKPLPNILEAEAGEDGVFRVVVGESPPHDEDLEEAIRKFREGMKEETERITRKLWGIDFAE